MSLAYFLLLAGMQLCVGHIRWEIPRLLTSSNLLAKLLQCWMRTLQYRREEKRKWLKQIGATFTNLLRMHFPFDAQVLRHYWIHRYCIPMEPVPSVILSVDYLAEFGSDLGWGDWFGEALVRIHILIGQSSSFKRISAEKSFFCCLCWNSAEEKHMQVRSIRLQFSSTQ